MPQEIIIIALIAGHVLTVRTLTRAHAALLLAGPAEPGRAEPDDRSDDWPQLIRSL